MDVRVHRAVGVVGHTSTGELITLGTVVSHASDEVVTSSACHCGVGDLLVPFRDNAALRLSRSVHVLVVTAACGAEVVGRASRVGACSTRSAGAGAGVLARVSERASRANDRVGRTARAVGAWSASFAARLVRTRCTVVHDA